MNTFVIGLCGGSGAGKTTLAYGLEANYPGQVTIFHLDDYFRLEADVPKLNGMTNWDDPKALFSDKMIKDLARLKTGKPVLINTKSPRYNPDFLKTGKRIPIMFQLKSLIVVEGFLTFYYAGLRELLDLKIFLETPFEIHSNRRAHGKLHNFPLEYKDQVLKPMHEKYIFPYKIYADLIINVDGLNEKTVLKTTKQKLTDYIQLKEYPK